MPAGTVLNPEGPNDQIKLGQILSANLEVYPFFNVGNLPVDYPVVFDVIATPIHFKADINGVKYNYNGKVALAVIPKEINADTSESVEKWSPGLQKRWKDEWSAFSSDEEVEKKMGVKLRESVKQNPHL